MTLASVAASPNPSFSAALPDGQAAVFLAALAFAGIAAAAWRADWRRFAAGADAHLFWGCVVSVAVLWHLRATLPPGSGLHLLGATAVCALCGLRIALVVLAAGIGLQHLGDGVHWAAFGPAWLVGALVPGLLARAMLGFADRFAGRRLGPMPGVAASFAAGAASMIAVLVVSRVTGAAPGLHVDAADFAAIALLMAIAEANLSVSVLGTIAAAAPGWLRATPPRDARIAVRSARRGPPPGH